MRGMAGPGKRARHFQAAYWKWRSRRALGGERREERRCGAEQLPILRVFREKPRGRGGFLVSPQDRLRLPHCLVPNCLVVKVFMPTKSKYGVNIEVDKAIC